MIDSSELEKKIADIKHNSFEKAESLLLLAICYFNNNRKKTIKCAKQYAKIFFDNEKFKDFNQVIAYILESDEREFDCYEEMDVYFKAAEYYKTKNPKKALDIYMKGIVFTLDDPTDQLLGLTYNKIAYQYYLLGKFDIARENLVDNFRNLNLQERPDILARNKLQLGELNYQQGDYDEALDNYFKSLELYEQQNKEHHVSCCYNSIGTVYYSTKDYKRAEEFFGKAKKIKIKYNDDYGLAFSLNNLGAVALCQKKLDKANGYFLKSLEIRKKLNHYRGVVAAMSNIGGVYFEQGKFEKALDQFAESYELSIERDDKHQAALTLGNMALAEQAMEHWDQAEKYALKELELAEQSNEKPLQKSALSVLTDVCEKKEDYRKAYQYHRQLKDITEQIYNIEKDEKIAKLNHEYEMKIKASEAEIYKLKNIELAKANELIREKNCELETYKDDLILINKILRHDLINNLAIIRTAFKMFEMYKDESVINDAAPYVEKSVELISKMRQKEMLCRDYETKSYKLSHVINSTMVNYPKMDMEIEGDCRIAANESIFPIIDNIVNNAVIHSGTKKIRFEINKNFKRCNLRIIDYGIGIDPTISHLIFEEGFKYGVSGKNGIGLYLVKKAIEHIGGSIKYLPNKPQGTIFEIILHYISEPEPESQDTVQ